MKKISETRRSDSRSELGKQEAAKNGASAAATTDAERDWAQAAQTEFNKGNYGPCLVHLNKLYTSRPKDTKVQMNKAVVEYYKTDMKKTDIFMKGLQSIISNCCPKSDQPVDTSIEVEQSVVHLNHAIILFHLHQYRAAMSILQNMNNGLESLEESVGIGVCLLLAECCLGSQQPARTLSVVAHTEATFLPQPLPPHTASPKQLHHDSHTKSPEKVMPVSSNSSNTSSSSSISSNSSSSNSSINNTNNGITATGGSDELRCSSSQEQLRNKLQLLRVRALLMMRTLRLGKKELKTVVTQAVNTGNQLNMTLITLKSQLEYLRGNRKKAIKVLNQCGAIPPPAQTCGPSLGVVYYNNMGVIHLGLDKPTLSCLYLQKAMTELQQQQQTQDTTQTGDPLSNRNLYQVGSSVSPELCYNLGVTLLHMNKPTSSFDFFLEVVQAHPDNPRLWLRLAECCIAIHKLDLRDDTSLGSLRRNAIQTSVGTGAHRKICLAPSINDHDKKLTDQQQLADAAFPEPTLEFGRLCLANALILLPDNISPAPFTDEQEASGVVPELYPAGPSSPMRGTEVLNVRISCLASSAYIALCLTDYPAALKHAQNLLSVHPKIPHTYKLLGNLYAGEALICLSRTSEAVTHLDPRQVGDLSLSPPPQDPTQASAPCTQAWSMENTSNALQVIKYNLSVVYTLRGELEKANGLLKEVWTDLNVSVPSQVVMLAMYIQLKLGNSDVMMSILKKQILST